MDIEAYIAVDDPAIAVVFVEKLIRRTDALIDQPFSSRFVPAVPGRDLRELIEGDYRIVYRVSVSVVEILTVFEALKRFSLDG